METRGKKGCKAARVIFPTGEEHSKKSLLRRIQGCNLLHNSTSHMGLLNFNKIISGWLSHTSHMSSVALM